MIILQERDIKILKWALEMRFMNVEMIHRSFFRDSGTNMSTARNRIRLLEKEGYLKKTIGYDGTSRSYYLVTKKAYNFVRNNYPELHVVSPLKNLSPHNFLHDKRVALSRIELEREGRASNWKSERFLKAEFAERSIYIARKYMPDAIFESKIGINCAFELEISPKTQKRYQDKIDKFVEIMEEENSLFGLCLFVVEADFTFNFLKKITHSYGNRFRVQKYKEIITNV